MTFVTDDRVSLVQTDRRRAARMFSMAVPDLQKQVLSRVALFSGLTESEMAFISGRVVPRKYAPGQIVFNEGDACSGLYIVASGHVRIFKTSANVREQVLNIDGPGSSVAELPVFDGGNYPASVAAADDTVLLFVSKEDFRELCLTHPQVALKVLRIVGTRLRRLVGIIEELSFTTVKHRLAALLVRAAHAEGKKQEQAPLSTCRTITRRSRRKSAPCASWSRGI